MIHLKLFEYDSNEIRVIKDDQGNPWFVAKDVCAALDILYTGATLSGIKPQWKGVRKLNTPGGVQNFKVINEAALYKFVFRSNKPNAEAFTDWVADVVLPEIRKTGSFSLEKYLLRLPSQWEKTYTDEFYAEALRLYNMTYSPAKNPPQFIGKFTNQYVYRALDKKLPQALKVRQEEYETEAEVKFLMHQYLNGEAREVLKHHLSQIILLMKISSNIDQFKIQWEKLYVHKNQLELYLR